MQKFMLACITAMITVNSVFADVKTMDRVRFFDTFSMDAVRLDSLYIKIGAAHKEFKNGSSASFQIRAGFPIMSNIDIEASLGGINVDPDFAHEQMDVNDFSLVGRYHFLDFKPANLSVGMRFDFPVGDDDQGQDTLEFEAFGAIRIPVNEKVVTAAHLGFGYIETHELTRANFNSIFSVMYTGNGVVGSTPGTRIKNEGEFAFFANSSIIYEYNSKLHFTGEFSGDTGHDVGYFTSGVDYEVIPNGRLRFAVWVLGLVIEHQNTWFKVGFYFNFGNLFNPRP